MDAELLRQQVEVFQVRIAGVVLHHHQHAAGLHPACNQPRRFRRHVVRPGILHRNVRRGDDVHLRVVQILRRGRLVERLGLRSEAAEDVAEERVAAVRFIVPLVMK